MAQKDPVCNTMVDEKKHSIYLNQMYSKSIYVPHSVGVSLIRTLANIDTEQNICLISYGVARIRSSSFPSLNGYPDEKIIEFVNSEKFDLIVILGLSGLSKTWVVVSERARCPVLVVH
jgi:hypothetical protein